MGVTQIKRHSQELAPVPPRVSGRAHQLYQVMDALGGEATLAQVHRMIPAVDMKQPKNRVELRAWVSSSCLSKGYWTRIGDDKYRISTLAEYKKIKVHNTKKADAYRLRRTSSVADAQSELTENLRAAVSEYKTLEPLTALKQKRSDFVHQYLGSLIGTSMALVIFYAVMRLT